MTKKHMIICAAVLVAGVGVGVFLHGKKKKKAATKSKALGAATPEEHKIVDTWEIVQGGEFDK